MLLVLAASPAQPQTPTPTSSPALALPSALTPNKPLRIGTRLIKPDAFEEKGQIVGFSADIGRSILEQLQVKAELKTYPDVPQLLNALRSDQVDLGISAITVTSQREQDFDFSHPIISGELQIMLAALPNQPNSYYENPWWRLVDPKLLRLLGIVMLSMLVPVHILWYFERNNPELITNPSYFPGIFQALWWTILALIGQAGEMPKGPVSRIMALFWVIAGIIFVSYFTAIITTEFTVHELQGNIQSLSDLQNRRVAVLADNEVVNYLQDKQIQQVIQFTQPEEAYQALLSDKVDALVAPSPLLLYYASHDWKGTVEFVGKPFRERFYSIVMPKDSPYRKPINQAILTLKENGTYEKIYKKWFGVSPEIN